MYMEDKDWERFSPFFRKTEFKCPCGKCNGYGKGIHKSLVITLNFIRRYYNKSITITSGYRCPDFNKKVGGIANSKHTQGLAADFWFTGMNKTTVLNHLKKTPYHIYSYTNETNMRNAVHIDTRAIDFGTNTVEKIVEKRVEIPVEVIKEIPIEIIKEIEVIREIPVEVIKEAPRRGMEEYTLKEIINEIIRKITNLWKNKL